MNNDADTTETNTDINAYSDAINAAINANLGGKDCPGRSGSPFDLREKMEDELTFTREELRLVQKRAIVSGIVLAALEASPLIALDRSGSGTIVFSCVGMVWEIGINPLALDEEELKAARARAREILEEFKEAEAVLMSFIRSEIRFDAHTQNEIQGFIAGSAGQALVRTLESRRGTIEREAGEAVLSAGGRAEPGTLDSLRHLAREWGAIEWVLELFTDLSAPDPGDSDGGSPS